MQPLIEAVPGSEGRQWDVLLIQTGTSLNGNHYPASTLREAAPLFAGVYAYADHSAANRSVKDKVGRFSDPVYGMHEVGGQMVEGIKARFKVVAPWLRELLVEAVTQQETDFVGFSIDAIGRAVPKVDGGRRVNWVEKIDSVRSVDVVSEPAAGGRIVRLVASVDAQPDTSQEQHPSEDNAMDPEEITRLVAKAVAEAVSAKAEPVSAEVAALREQVRLSEQKTLITEAVSASKISDLGKGRLKASLVETASRRDLTPDEINSAIREATEYEAALVGQKAPDASSPAVVTKGKADKVYSGLMGFFEGADVDGLPRFRSLREAYVRWSGMDAFEVSGVDVYRALLTGSFDSAVDHRRVTESLTTSSWSDVFGDVMYKQMMKQYSASNYGTWRNIVSDVESVPDFMTRHWVRVGGYSDLSAVTEQSTYPQITSPDDEEIEYAVSKRGGIEDITLEAIVNDRSGAIRRIPGNMARSAARTLFKFVFGLATTSNPTLDYDSTVLYVAGHSNTGTSALSLDALNTAVIAMRDQTAYGESSEILGSRNFPKYILVPNELEALANRVINPSGAYGAMILDSDAAASGGGTGIDPQQFANKGIQIIVLDFLTDANDWFLIANPAEVPTIVMGFLNGREDPEMFVQDQPTIGSVFTADKISYKIRHIYGGDVADHRSFYRNVVS